MYYLEPLAQSTTTLSPKIHGIQQLLGLEIPTIKLPFITTKEFFQEYFNNRKISDKAWSEFGHVFATIATNSSVTLRHNAYESSNLELTFVAPNSLNISSFDSFRRIIETNCKLLASKVINPNKADVRFILQSYYKSIKCGSLNHDGNNIEINTILGEHTRALQVEGIAPDIYRAPASTSSFKLTQLGEHSRIIKVTRHGLKTIENRLYPYSTPILNALQLKNLANWSRLIFKKYGAHSLYFAELTNGDLIIQNLLTKKEVI